MELSALDYTLIIVFFTIVLGIGVVVSKKSGKSSSEYFLSGRTMPWWLLGLSMVATTFSTDTPNLVTDIVRTDGVSGNWVWWAFLITGMLTVFVYAKLWRKSNVNTDLEFYELRYGGKPASFLRKFRSIYLGVIFNVITMSAVTLAAIKIGGIMLGLEPWQTVVSAGLITVTFSALGGFKGVVYTDFLLFFVAMGGAIGAAYYLVNLPEVGGVTSLLTHEDVKGKLSILPDFSNTNAVITLLVIPLAVQWWSSWYPGAEPGGGGYIAQRMLAAKDENHAIGATFFFNIMHYALRPWPWILVALASIVVYPDVASIAEAFPNIAADKLGHDLAYPAMLTKLPSGLLGLVLASLIAAYMSTISTQLNWGSSYIVYDFYKQQVNPNASEKQLVAVGRFSTVVLMVLSACLALLMQNAMEVFDMLLLFGAGTGLIFILRWFWWRINAWTEIAAMFASGVLSILLKVTPLGNYLFAVDTGVFPDWFQIPFVMLVTTIIWVAATFMTKPESNEVLNSFYKKIQPGGPGWKKVVDNAKADKIDIVNPNEKWSVPSGIGAMVLGCVLIYTCMFATGYWIYGETIKALIFTGIALVAGLLLIKAWNKMKSNIL
ncbi:sodium:solute symporter family protein [Cellulophaga lytica]|uniref:Na+/solute symporter n=1 Tax=Cellulophaga lytica (strain ATCC 23178 / DSM 7489 / JCM 8516 / NBRC 14961 / NCIMB 1423 / VKM B-1433 / Cy l20) TaxID=867900 RepID=F0RGS3_CELLC|nr:sodium:solute symporter family protein [Cellulophaga lytica]ADY29102.1 Na+/solute symporter [Cellulophaga lytica DSM 7489]AIM60144.1 Na+:solute symporter [Cellulophaga lytica]APU10009.1 Na+:solute symporter [Cellulophaga lytica]MDO6854202.1 sodium:solute symporter family protein [Cellulophaga lytica]WQG76726.1 sodium:solute symporter family protein [Cellulophaga lytica]